IPVYIVAGQSNTDGRASMEEMPEEVRRYVAEDGASDIMISYCNGVTRNELGKFTPYVPMYEGNDSERCGFDAILYNKLGSVSGKPLYVIKESKGGTSIDTLCTSSGGLYWNADETWLGHAGIARYDRNTKETIGKSLLLQLEANVDSCVRSALSKSPEGYVIKCIIWHQGESDRSQGDRYHDNLKRLVEHLRHHIAESTGDSAYLHLPFIAGGVSRESRQYSESVEQAKRLLAQEDPDFHYVDLEGCGLRADDHLHFNGNGCREVADRFFRRMKDLDLLP
ncbi:MAG: sialate O-acetylesterase, partial [Muribaculaceae bacterium]|nr:sialate O-acetylesterase [Muribaculaceae bacterium]